MAKKNTSLYSSQDNEVLSLYLRQIDRIPLLNKDEEYDLAVRAKNGDRKARDRIAEANLRFVVTIAKKYRGQGLPLEDLINEGNIGLLTAIDKFEPEKGYHFISYAVWWIRQSILKALSDQSRPVRLPLNRTNEFNTIMKAKNALMTEKGIVSPTVEEIAEESGLDRDTVRTLLDITREMISLDAPIKGDANSDDDSASYDSFVGDTTESPENQMIDHMCSKDVKALLSTLSDKERDIIMKRYGFGDEEPMSLSAIGVEYSLTKERIRQIEKSALDKLRRNGESMGLEYYNAV